MQTRTLYNSILQPVFNYDRLLFTRRHARSRKNITETDIHKIMTILTFLELFIELSRKKIKCRLFAPMKANKVVISSFVFVENAWRYLESFGTH